jgi:hypothetical protein
MIEWTIPGTVVGTTGSSSTSSSYESSASYSTSVFFTDAANSNSVSQSASSNGSTAASGETIVDGVGATTRTFSSFSSTFNYADGTTAAPKPEIEPTGGSQTIFDNSDGTSASTSQNGETTTVFTAIKVSSTSSTYESGYDVYSYLGVVSADEVYGLPTAWTSLTETYDSENTALTTVVFSSTEVSTTTSYSIEFSTRQGTTFYTETLAETITLSGLPDTVVQAAPDEILYVIRTMPTTWDGYLAATGLAESGTRFTLSPALQTIGRPTMSASTPTSMADSSSFSTGLNYSVVTSSQATITSASYSFFPPETTTRTVSSFSLRSSSASLSLNLPEQTFGGGTTTISQTTYFSVPTTVRRQTQSQTYAGLTQSTFSLPVSSTIQAAVTLDSSFTTGGTFRVLIDVADFAGSNGTSSGTTSHAEGNTTISVPRAVLSAGTNFGRTKYRTSGAVVGSQTGGWITANASSEGLVFPLYALNGSGRNGQTVFPQTNSRHTVSGNSITWTTSTAASESTGTQATTASASFGIDGEPTLTTDVRPLSIFGGDPGKGCTVVERPGAGVYKDRIGGSTTTFSEGDISFSEGETRPVRNWFTITHVGPVALRGNLNPVTWSEQRNSALDLPPNTPQF